MPETWDALILSNGPGELATWVRPIVVALKARHPEVRVSVILAPCSNASGQEAAFAQSMAGIDRVQSAKHYRKFLLTGKTADAWDWHPKGVTIFLGGDQGFSALISRRLGYPIVVYAELQARWPQFIHRYGLKAETVRDSKSSHKERFKGQFKLIGDLMADGVRVGSQDRDHVEKRLDLEPGQPLIGLMPGSKAMKLSQGIPLVMGTAEYMQSVNPNLRFVIPVAPTTSVEYLASFANPKNRDIAATFGTSAMLVQDGSEAKLVTPKGTAVQLWTQSPAYDLLSRCTVCITAIGANTAELGFLGIPMLVCLPSNRLEAMRAWDGLPGLLVNLPGVGTLVAKTINGYMERRLGFLAWPNIRAQEELVPELRGILTPQIIGDRALELLADIPRREKMSSRLKAVMGLPGAAKGLLDLVDEVLAPG
ncbi:MAG: lipid-A-disaccharide synthase [Gloeobacterales cyanobacterium]